MKRILSLALAALCLGGAATAQKYPGYTLYSTQGSNKAYLLDTNGTTFHTWNFTSGSTAYSTYMVSGGTLFRTVTHMNSVFNGGGGTGEVQKWDYAGNLLWDFVYSTSTYALHHDICPMANGNVLMISYELKSAADVQTAGCTQNISMWPDKIIEVQPSGATGGNIVWEWHAWDHLSQSVNSAKNNYVPSVSAHPELLNVNYQTTQDWMHTNGIDYNPTLDQIVISSHNMNELYVIDHSTTTAQAASHSGGNAGKGGDILYRWGNPAAYSAAGTADFNVVHDAHWVPQGCPRAGYLVGFNNNGVSNNISSIDMINPPLNGLTYTLSGTSYGPTTYNYRHQCHGHTNDMGNSQQLPNGNMLVTIAQSGYIYEIDSNQNMVWSKTITGTVPQSFRYSACYVSGTAPATPTVTQNGAVFTASTGASYQWYKNGTAIAGATSQTYTATGSGTYSVAVGDANGCLSALSTAIAYTATGINGVATTDGLALFPNPATGMVQLSGSLIAAGHYEVTVFDAFGKMIAAPQATSRIDLTGRPNGVYYFLIRTESKTVSSRITVMH